MTVQSFFGHGDDIVATKPTDDVTEREARRVEDEAEREAAHDDVVAALSLSEVVCRYITDDDEECGEDRLLFRVGDPVRGLDALIPPAEEIVCGEHLIAVLTDATTDRVGPRMVAVEAEPA